MTSYENIANKQNDHIDKDDPPDTKPEYNPDNNLKIRMTS
jgi:hypothetical protein